MDRKRVQTIVKRWMFPTEGGSYMGGLERRPVLASSKGSIVVDTDGKEYLDFQSGQMGAALGHQHPRIVAVIEKTIKSMLHASNTMLNVPRLRLHERGVDDPHAVATLLVEANGLLDQGGQAAAGPAG